MIIRKIRLVPVALFVSFALFPFGKNKIAYDHFDWQVYPTQHFEIYHYPEEKDALSRVAAMAETAYEKLARKFNYRIDQKIPFIIYRTHAEFEETNVILNFIPEGVGAFAEPIRNRMVMPIDLTDDRLQKLILHELTHVFQFEYFFQGSKGKDLWNNPPQWFMEGMASYMADDEDSFAKMILRDAVVNDMIPSISSKGVTGYFAYRFGHAAMDFIEEKWGEEGMRTFFYEYRSNLSSNMEKALDRAFDITPEEFDRQFRLYLRKKYLPMLVATGEPQEFGRPFLLEEKKFHMISPAFSPSGETMVAVGTLKNDVDVILLSSDGNVIIDNLTPGIINNYQYLIASLMTTGPHAGKDVAFSPTGNEVAYLVRKGKGRTLYVQNIFSGKVREIKLKGTAQELSPAFSPEGRYIALHAWVGTQSDILLYDLKTEKLENVTNDQPYDECPSFSPDGEKIVFSREVGTDTQLFLMDMEDPTTRQQLTFTPGKHVTGQFSPDGEWIYYAWDQGDMWNIYRLQPDTGKVEQLTNAVTGCYSPAIHMTKEGKPFLVFNGFYKGRMQLFYREDPEPIQVLKETREAGIEPEAYQPLIEVPIDPDKLDRNPAFKLSFEDARVQVGVNTDQRVVSYSYIRFADLLGNRHLRLNMESVSNYTNTRLTYFDLSRRTQWGASAYDYRTYYLTYNYLVSGGRYGERERIQRYTGATFFLQYPFSFTHRVSLGLGYQSRSINYPVSSMDASGNQYWDTVKFSDNFPYLEVALNGDTAVYQSFGPYAGRRFQLSYLVSPRFSGQPKTYNMELDFRQYLPFGRRSLIAWRLFAAKSGGEFQGVYSFGGLDTMRGFDFRELYGTHVAYTNLEVRFPLVDVLKFPFLKIHGIRGRFFLDVGGAWFEEDSFQLIHDNRLKDGVSTYGFGFTINILGLDCHWDFARKWDLKDAESGTETSFWIGRRF